MTTNDTEAGDGAGAEGAERTSTSPFYVVGVGASAGGIESVGAFLAHLPRDAGVAVVVVMHLDPTHASDLAAILAKHAAMPVAVALDGLRVEPGRVSVIPPNATLSIRGGTLGLTPRDARVGLNLPVDMFFRSLAEDFTARAVGVVLSGTGSDGALGVQAIRSVGGVTFAQDGSAGYAGMPRAAIATGCVDFVLPPDAIAREIVRLQRLPALSEAPHPDDEALLQQVFGMLRAAGGADFASYKRSSVRRRIQRRVQITRSEGLREYAELLRSSPEEVAVLSEDVLIHVTSFFRDPSVFDALKREVFPRLVEGRGPAEPLRVWVPGCSTGEELYSIAIALMEYLAEAGATNPVKLFGTDLSAAAIERARGGRYVENIEADVSAERLRRFFVKGDGGYQVRRDLRDLCVFARHDVTRDPPFSGMDLVSCRNLMIYLDAPLQSKTLQIFHYALRERGFLLLGASETAGAFGGFTAVDRKVRIFARTGPPTRILPDLRPWAEYAPGASRSSAAPVRNGDIQREADRAVLGLHGPPGVVVTDDRTVVLFRGNAGPYVAPASGAASLDIVRLARADLRVALRQALDEAARTDAVARSVAHRGDEPSGAPEVEVEVIPFRASSSQRLYVVLFRDVASSAEAPPDRGLDAPSDLAPDPALRQELASMREYLQSIIAQFEATNEELSAANEEAVSNNEELHSANEELQLAKEELQASNEELATVNGELMERNAEATRLNDDLMNLLASVAIPIVILGRDGAIRRFTPAAGRALGILASDLGRPFTDLRSRLQAPELGRMITEAQRALVPQERAVCDEHGRWYQLAVRPYLTAAGHADGVTITLFNLDAIKRVEREREEEYQARLQRASFDAVLAEERERRRIATDLHDRLGQSLAFLQIRLTSLRNGLTGPAHDDLDECVGLVAGCVEETRTLTFDLSPPVLYDLGLEAAVGWLAEQFARRYDLRVAVEGPGVGPLVPDVAAVLFRSVRELLVNVVKHARCDRARVTLTRAEGEAVVAVEDEGVGIDATPGAHSPNGFGLFSIREQISRLGGAVDLISSAGTGTRVRLRVPPDANQGTPAEKVRP